ncbi:MAG: protein kinase domain-containing protein, partial [Bacteroidota bacterium]
MNPGDKIGNYRVLHLIGEGGMSAVFEAEHERLRRRVAIKVLHPALSVQSSIRNRFINEAQLMETLEHPGITRILDFYEQGDELALVM